MEESEDRTTRLLFLDDSPARHSAFSKMAEGALVKHVHTAKECMEALASEPPFDCVFLDHDLGGREFVEDIVGHGTEVALFIRDELPVARYPGKFVIHSKNPAGARRMFHIISETGVPTVELPFSYPRT